MRMTHRFWMPLALAALVLLQASPGLAYDASVPVDVWTTRSPLVEGNPEYQVGALARAGGYVALAGQLVAPGSADPFVALADATNGTVLWQYRAGGPGELHVAVSDDAGVVAFPQVGDAPKLLVFLDRVGTPAWSAPLPAGTTLANVDVTPDGSRILVAAQSGTTAVPVVFTVYDRAGSVVWTSFVINPYSDLREVKLTADGTRAMVRTAAVTFVVSPAGIVSPIVHYSCCVDTSADLSRDGRFLVVGDAQVTGAIALYAYEPRSGRYVPAWAAATGRNSVRHVVLSDDGSTLGVGANNRSNALAVHFSDGLVLLYSTSRPTPLWSVGGYGQDAKIDQVDLSANGSRVAVAAWGSLDDPSAPTLSVFERASPSPLVSFTPASDSLGAAREALLSAQGDRVVAIGSTGHPYQSVSDSVLVGVHLE